MTDWAFLRDDIYNNLKFEDKNKITENNVAPVFWDHGPNHKTLKGLMEKRFKVACSQTLRSVGAIFSMKLIRWQVASLNITLW